MTYKQTSDLLIEIGARLGITVRSVDVPGLAATALCIVPVAWFIATDLCGDGQLNLGMYVGDDLRLLGTAQIKVRDLTPERLKELIEAAVPEVKGVNSRIE